MQEYVRTLLDAPLPRGAEIHSYNPDVAPAGYIDAGYAAGEQPHPITEEDADKLISHGAVDTRRAFPYQSGRY